MVMNNSCTLVLIWSFLVILLTFRLLSAQQVGDSEFDSDEGSEQGEDICETGRIQSPIDIANKEVFMVPRHGEFDTNYNRMNATLKNSGDDIEIHWVGNAGSIQIYGVNYALERAHWHFPSEHTMCGRKFDLELHMVHRSSHNKIAVVGILFNLGAADKVLSELTEGIKKTINGTKKEVKVGIVDPSLMNDDGEYYRYIGSLTTPPCTEGVMWTINKKVKTVSKEQLRLLKVAVHSDPNSRPVQPLNGRIILLYFSLL